MAGHVPLRMCTICRRQLPKPELIRTARRPGGRLGWAPEGPIRGKGLYFCRSADCLGRLFDERRFRRQYLETMEEECIEQLRALRARTAPSSGGLEAQM